MLKHCRPDIIARGHLSLLHRYVRTYLETTYTIVTLCKFNSHSLDKQQHCLIILNLLVSTKFYLIYLIWIQEEIFYLSCNKLKLYKYGIRGIALEWIKDYLLNRKQYVVYNNTKSNISIVEIGVPQGTILGPLLLLIYVNELPNISSTLSCIQFADDTSIFIRGRSLPKITSILNQEMEKKY